MTHAHAPVQDEEVCAVLLLDQAAQRALQLRVEVAHGVHVGVAVVLRARRTVVEFDDKALLQARTSD